MFRLLSLLGGLSVALDLGTGAAVEESLRGCLVATRFARALGATDEEVTSVLYTALLQNVGCTAAAHPAAAIFGDDIAAIRMGNLTDWSRRQDLVRTFVPGVASATGRSRLAVLASTVRHGPAHQSTYPVAVCEVARETARRLDLPADVQGSLEAVGAQWDGRGFPALRAEQIPWPARVTRLTWVAVMFTLHAGPRVAAEEVHRRSGTVLDPGLVSAFDRRLLDGIEEVDAYRSLLDEEPDPVALVDSERLSMTARAFGDLVDLKSPFLHGHSSAVGDLAHAAAGALGLPDAEDLRVAGYLHDLGRLAVNSRIWDKPGPLTVSERDLVELHPHHTERILARVPELRGIARLAGAHHERCDGSGYHRGLRAGGLPMAARVLAAADLYQNLVEPRPHRAARTPAEAAVRLRADARRGGLDGDAVRAVLTAAGQPSGSRTPGAGGLTRRQVEVVRLLAQGLSNREIGRQLAISPRTAERHVADVYGRLGVRTRAAVALFAMEHGLIAAPPAAPTASA